MSSEMMGFLTKYDFVFCSHSDFHSGVRACLRCLLALTVFHFGFLAHIVNCFVVSRVPHRTAIFDVYCIVLMGFLTKRFECASCNLTPSQLYTCIGSFCQQSCGIYKPMKICSDKVANESPNHVGRLFRIKHVPN